MNFYEGLRFWGVGMEGLVSGTFTGLPTSNLLRKADLLDLTARGLCQEVTTLIGSLLLATVTQSRGQLHCKAKWLRRESLHGQTQRRKTYRQIRGGNHSAAMKQGR